MGVWPEVMGGSWPPIKPQPESPHQAAIADSTPQKPADNEEKPRRRKASRET